MFSMIEDENGPEWEPEEVFLNAFVYLKTDWMTLASLLEIAEQYDFPSPGVAATILSNMVKTDLLEIMTVGDTTLFSPKPTPEETIH